MSSADENKRIRVLYVGLDGGTSRLRIQSLRRLGYDVSVIDPYKALPDNRFIHYWNYHYGMIGTEWVTEFYIRSKLKDSTFDLVFVDHGDKTNAATIRLLKTRCRAIVNYNQDNPYAPGEPARWRLFFGSLPFYDLVVTTKSHAADAGRQRGARKVLAVTSPADEALHRPIALTEEDRARFSADVVFVGTWMPERGPFMLRLVELGVPLRIYGARWNKAPEYDALREYIVLGNLDGEDYVKAIRGAKIALGLLYKAYGDLHTTRSVEIPAIGTLFCGERTSEHLAMYTEGEEAVFWDGPEDCARKCLDLLAQPERIRQIAEAGYRRVRQNRDFNEVLLPRIINEALNAEESAPDASRKVPAALG